MGLKRMDNVGIVVEDLSATIDFFREVGLELEGRATIEGEWAGRVTGLGSQHVEIAMMPRPTVTAGSSSRAFSRQPPSQITAMPR
jgi:catechol 2,3-dioxygenase-like lactoylglutathione lyase family enzyme